MRMLVAGSTCKAQKIGIGPTEIPLNFESDLHHNLDTKVIIWIFRFTYQCIPWWRQHASFDFFDNVSQNTCKEIFEELFSELNFFQVCVMNCQL